MKKSMIVLVFIALSCEGRKEALMHDFRELWCVYDSKAITTFTGNEHFSIQYLDAFADQLDVSYGKDTCMLVQLVSSGEVVHSYSLSILVHNDKADITAFDSDFLVLSRKEEVPFHKESFLQEVSLHARDSLAGIRVAVIAIEPTRMECFSFEAMNLIYFDKLRRLQVFE